MAILETVVYAFVIWWIFGVVCIGVLAISADIKHYKEIKYGPRRRLKNARRTSTKS